MPRARRRAHWHARLRRQVALSESEKVSSAPHSDHHAEPEPRPIGILVEKAYRGDKVAFAELRRRGGPSAVDGWFRAFEAQQAKRDLMNKLDELRRLDDLLGRSPVTPRPRCKGRP